ncbi:hypothetical protein G7K_6779-t1 [Saitoella complicata NRRL Y-17804]|uniref:Serine/threonine-protein kinase MEC1 n=3 Tax=Saitoella complicata (strain BCRC 22490 / CBS 7301 / JCM 7358 / NBRC 10748 / NRRL Y-17804) TaxID=698492 RepID=A0A0E9NSF7_SAICN|nr:hypothetical protein G7K_6779-t1 [Saitoella complicata NRRL Y-17804]
MPLRSMGPPQKHLSMASAAGAQRALPSQRLPPHGSILASQADITDQNVFRQLINEVLRLPTSNNDGPDASAFDVELDTNYQLIQVVTNVGLAPLADNESPGELDIQQAHNTLLVIRITMQRTPKVLYQALAQATSPEKVILALWLLPYVTKLLGHPKLTDLHEDIIQTLEDIFKTLLHATEAGPVAKDFVVGIQARMQKSLAVVSRLSSDIDGYGYSGRADHAMALLEGALLMATIFQLYASLYAVNPGYFKSAGLPDMCLWYDSAVTLMVSWQATQFDTRHLHDIRHHVLSRTTRALAFLLSTSCGGISERHMVLRLSVSWAKIMLHDRSAQSEQDLTLLFGAFGRLSEDATVPNSAFGGLWELLQRLGGDARLGDICSGRVRAMTMILQENFQRHRTSIGLRVQETTVPRHDNSKPVETGTDLSSERPPKRIRLELPCAVVPVKVDTVIASLLATLKIPCESPISLGKLEELLKEPSFINPDNALVISVHIGYMACALRDALTRAGLSAYHSSASFTCRECDALGDARMYPYVGHDWARDVGFDGLLSLLQIVHQVMPCQASGKLRLAVMHALERVVRHTVLPEELRLTQTSLGKWALQTVQSSVRRLRIAAGRTLAGYCSVRAGQDFQDIVGANRRVVLETLRKVSEREDAKYLESCLLSWGYIGRDAPEQELNIILLHLVEFLGHGNTYLRAVAYNEIQGIAEARDQTTWRLLSPFWPTVSINIVRRMKSRPQVIQLVSDLLGITVADFLNRTQNRTIPHLILTKRQDIVILIAKALQRDVARLCFDNMPHILAALLTQEGHGAEDSIMLLLSLASSEFEKLDLASLVRSDPIFIAVELLKMFSGSNEAKSSRIFKALQMVASIVMKSQGTSGKDAVSRVDYLAAFFKRHILGIMANFTDTINDVRGRQTSAEKLSCIVGIEKMIDMARASLETALPQITACLQSALADEMLREPVLMAWTTLMGSVQPPYIGALLGYTLSTIMQFWPISKEDERQQMLAICDHIFEVHMDSVVDELPMIPDLSLIPELAQFEAKLSEQRAVLKPSVKLRNLIRRCNHENIYMCHQALLELRGFLVANNELLHSLTLRDQPDQLIEDLIRSLLDICSKYHNEHREIERLCAECLGIVGAVDPNRVNAARDVQDIIVVHNFEDADESISFVLGLIEEQLVPAFRASTDTKSQGFLAYAMQELLKFCGFTTQILNNAMFDGSGTIIERWSGLSAASKETLTPLLASKYFVTASALPEPEQYPTFSSHTNYRSWLQAFVLSLMTKVTGDNAKKIFAVSLRIVKDQDVAISSFLLPYVALNVIVGGTDEQRDEIAVELLAVLQNDISSETTAFAAEKFRLAGETVFRLIDYLNKWLRKRRKFLYDQFAATAKKANRYLAPDEGTEDDSFIRRVEVVLAVIPEDMMARASYNCGSFARGLFHWEQYIRKQRQALSESELEPLYRTLQHIYSKIDEPDEIEAISAKFSVINLGQQILEHEVTGKWTSAQTCYELCLQQQPEKLELQVGLLRCLNLSGHYETSLNQVDSWVMKTPQLSRPLAKHAVESAWLVGDWKALERHLGAAEEEGSFEVVLGRAILSLREKDTRNLKAHLQQIYDILTHDLVASGVKDSRQCYDVLVKLHGVQEFSMISEACLLDSGGLVSVITNLERRLDLLAPSTESRQFVLALRRTAFELAAPVSSRAEVSAIWLDIAKLARKAGQSQRSYNAILKASEAGAPLAAVERARWLWHEGEQHRAIQSLESALKAGTFDHSESIPDKYSSAITTDATTRSRPKNQLLAKAKLLLAKWMESSEQSGMHNVLHEYIEAARAYDRWEKCHYYLGRYYLKLYENEEKLPVKKQGDNLLTGELTRLIVVNFGRALHYGVKYVFQTMPRFLTLWLDFGANVGKIAEDAGSPDYRAHTIASRQNKLKVLNEQVTRYAKRLPPYIFLTAFPQIISRIGHSNASVYAILEWVIVSVISNYPQQALWSLMAACKSTGKLRAERGNAILARVKDSKKKGHPQIRDLVNQAKKMTDQLLQLCNFEISGRQTTLSLSKHMRFQHSVAPSSLVVPLQSALTLTLPSSPVTLKYHHPFPGDLITIESFQDEVDIMNSLQKPRKITIRGSNGRRYHFLCKPKDDLRKDARLMEFNGMINKFLRKDAEASRRRLGIRTYAVVVLNEECGLLEWVNNTRPFRDILMKIYRQKGVVINYTEIRSILDQACASNMPGEIFNTKLLPKFPPVFHEWFIETFSEPTDWLASRQSYARTLAVMSMVGYVLGLGDRHGENILFDETNGDAVHVDFNCLFEKGLTFEKPEKVPFRLTHNMVDAFGVTGCDGTFRKSCEVTVRILRGNKDSLMSVLETFLHDPLVEWNRRKRANQYALENEEGHRALENIRRKLEGYIGTEVLPLSVAGQVQELIRQATNPDLLAQMYVGWASFT